MLEVVWSVSICWWLGRLCGHSCRWVGGWGGTYVGDVGSLVLGELLVVAQEQDGVLQREGVVKVALGLALRSALHLADVHTLNKYNETSCVTNDWHD